jgi:hypothetical protein
MGDPSGVRFGREWYLASSHFVLAFAGCLCKYDTPYIHWFSLNSAGPPPFLQADLPLPPTANTYWKKRGMTMAKYARISRFRLDLIKYVGIYTKQPHINCSPIDHLQDLQDVVRRHIMT